MMINWRQLYNESQAIKPDDTNLSTERISRLVNIYKNDLIEQDLHRYASRLLKFSRTCQICTSKSYTTYKWIDTLISGEKNLFHFRLSGRSVSAFVYYWNKHRVEENDKRGQISDFQEQNEKNFSMIHLTNIDENILIEKHSFISIISHWITRFQMYYTYRKAQSLTPSIDVHLQPMKTFRSLFQTKISPIFVCFINEDNNLPQLFWTFRHLITIFNWPWTTKIFSTRAYQTKSIFEQWMINSLGFVDLSSLDSNRIELFRFLYRCLKTCQDNGPMIFLFDQSVIFQPTGADYCLMSFLCDLIRFDLSIPDVIIIPTCLYRANLSFSQPFLLKEMVESFVKKFGIQKQLGDLLKTQEYQSIYPMIDCLFQHLGYNAKPPIATRINFSHIIATMELCQKHPPSTVESIHSIFQNLVKTCSFIIMDNHEWNDISEEDIQNCQIMFGNSNSKNQLLTSLQNEYLLDILAALTILFTTESKGTISRVFEMDLFAQLKFLFFTFDHQRYLTLRPCQNLHHIIQHCQWRNYIPFDYIPQKSMTYRDTILSDHEWSGDDDDEELENEFLDQDENDDEICINDLPSKMSDINQCVYRINYQESLPQLKFFASLIAPLIEAVVLILKFHLDKQLSFFTLEGFPSTEAFRFHGTSNYMTDQTLSAIRRAYLFRSMDFANQFDEIPMHIEVKEEEIYPLSMEKLLSLHDEFVQLLTCLI